MVVVFDNPFLWLLYDSYTWSFIWFHVEKIWEAWFTTSKKIHRDFLARLSRIKVLLVSFFIFFIPIYSLREIISTYLKLTLVLIIVFIGTDVGSKSIVILLFLYLNYLLRSFDKPYFTKQLNEYDLNASISLMIIYYVIILANSFDSLTLDMVSLIILLIVNFQFVLSGLKLFFKYIIFLSFNSNLRKQNSIKSKIGRMLDSKDIFIQIQFFSFRCRNY